MAQNLTTPRAGEGFPAGYEIFNKPGNKLLHPEEGKYYVLDANDKTVAFGPQLAPLWDYAVQISTVKPINVAEQAVIATIGKLPAVKQATVQTVQSVATPVAKPVIVKNTQPIAKPATKPAVAPTVRTTVAPRLTIKKVQVPQKAVSQEAPWKKPAPAMAAASVPQKMEQKKPESKKSEPKKTKQAVAKKTAKKTPLTPVQKNGKQKKQPLAKVVQMVGKMVGNEIEVGIKAIDRFVRNYMGQRDSVEVRLSEPTPVRYAYVDPQWISDREDPHFKAAKISYQ